MFGTQVLRKLLSSDTNKKIITKDLKKNFWMLQYVLIESLVKQDQIEESSDSIWAPKEVLYPRFFLSWKQTNKQTNKPAAKAEGPDHSQLVGGGSVIKGAYPV